MLAGCDPAWSPYAFDFVLVLLYEEGGLFHGEASKLQVLLILITVGFTNLYARYSTLQSVPPRRQRGFSPAVKLAEVATPNATEDALASRLFFSLETRKREK